MADILSSSVSGCKSKALACVERKKSCVQRGAWCVNRRPPSRTTDTNSTAPIKDDIGLGSVRVPAVDTLDVTDYEATIHSAPAFTSYSSSRTPSGASHMT